MAGEHRALMRRAFSLIELIITILIISIFVAALAFMLQHIVEGLTFTSDTVKATSLARLEISKVNNLAYGDATLADGYNNTTSNYEGSLFDLNRSVSYVTGMSNNLKEVIVSVYPAGTTDTLIQVATYVADVSFGTGSGGCTPGVGGDMADALSITSGDINRKNLRRIDMENTSSEDITITAVTITFTGAGGIRLKKIRFDGSNHWTGTENSGATITLSTSFTLSANTFYNNTGKFVFSKNLSSATVSFTMSDGTTTPSYSWP